jgi:hypothetical protein
LLTIRQFCADPSRHPEDSGYRSLTLTGLTAYPNLEGATYASLVGDPARIEDRDAFDNHTIRTVVVRNWPDEDYLYRVFQRLNSNTVPLSPQELRQALVPGPFSKYLNDRASSSKALRAALRQAGPDFRMRDNELLLRALAFRLRSRAYAGNLKKFLDDTFEEFNRDWSTLASGVEEATAEFEEAVATTMRALGERSFTRFRPKLGYDSRFNRAIFDVFVFALGAPEVRQVVQRDPESLVSR